MTLFRYTYAWFASCFTALLLCFIALYAMGIRTNLIDQTQQQFRSHISLLQHRLESSDKQPDYQSLLQQLPPLSPGGETRLHVLAHDQHYSTVLPDREPQQQSLLLSGFWPPLSLQRTLLGNSAQTVSITVSMPAAALTPRFWQQLLPGALLGGAIYLAAMLITFVALRRKLRPLVQLARHPVSATQTLPPFGTNSLEAQAWVNMITHFNLQLEDIFRRQALEANKLKTQAYQDKVSGLGNRHYFINQLDAWLDNPQQAGLVLLKSTLLDQVYQQHGFETGDCFTRQFADDLNSNIVHAQVYLARLSYDEFAVLLPNISTDKLKQIGQAMLEVHQRQEKAHHGETSDSVFLGLLIIEQASSASHVLGQLDNILAQATRNPGQPLQLPDNPHQVPSFGKQQWKSLLLEAIENNTVVYQYQPVIDERQQPYHYEVFSSLKAKQARYYANQFLGAIEDVGAGVLLDKHVIAHHINILNADPARGPYAINLTTNSITDPAFNRWLGQALTRNQHLSERLHFDIPEACFIRTPDACSLLCSLIRFHKFRFGVDGYGRYFKSLAYLEEFRPDYAKVDYSYTHQLNDELKKQLLSSICRTAHSLNILTIATRVETETQLERLSDLFVSGFQGFYTEQKLKELRGSTGQVPTRH
ncbi:GGDEF domain-containing protein (plasmid) [Photobacterium sp. DA100]|uniref:EAL domain-containing protein n=1 Tax=Photobacterium sp. DA100 TaxID=3027472 RepID=UPI002479E369|nr:GGDEF domain-containing protein [Photobacterium sp. DA100]WEM44880.1 GGDEF domain-containing protein [Photobacterium sp. DA100]